MQVIQKQGSTSKEEEEGGKEGLKSSQSVALTQTSKLAGGE